MGGLIARSLKRELKLLLRRRRRTGLSLDRLESGVDAERLQDAKNCAGDSLIGAQTAKRDASLGAVIDERAFAVIAPRLAAIADIHLAAAMATPQKPCKKQLALPRCACGGGASLAGRVIGNDALIALELVPRDVAFMLLLEQDVPFRLRATQPAPHALAAFLDDGLARRAAESISAGIDRVSQDVVHRVVDRQLPDDATPFSVVRFGRQGDAFLSKPHMHLPHALQFSKLRKHQV